ncbi:MAG: T9SS type A sorting domain-containing protein [Bacteroidales bacterium]|nr:T9SS type A sorting domain-containing protein [Bacteroidales bacterium]MCF8389494.1 T9SS type A sorting domain-containing protein [Bacteroidales bacterium]
MRLKIILSLAAALLFQLPIYSQDATGPQESVFSSIDWVDTSVPGLTWEPTKVTFSYSGTLSNGEALFMLYNVDYGYLGESKISLKGRRKGSGYLSLYLTEEEPLVDGGNDISWSSMSWNTGSTWEDFSLDFQLQSSTNGIIEYSFFNVEIANQPDLEITDIVVTYNYEIHFSYDASGNRTARNCLYLDSDDPKKSLSKPILNGSLNTKNYLVYPNPTSSYVLIDVENYSFEDKGSLRLIDLYGRTLFFTKEIFATNRIDMDEYLDGSYFIILEINGENRKFKIIKQ